ncbi:MAG: DUF5069 domain-containing protein [Terrimicrobiaceae bacterium]
MPRVEGLRGPYELVGGLMHFGRMVDKMRLHAAGKLPPGYVPFLGESDPTTFDGRVCRFLKVDYEDLTKQVKQARSDEDLLRWAFSRGHSPSEEESEIFNAFMMKRGWRDEASANLRQSAIEVGVDDVATYFDFIDLGEDRPARFSADPPPCSEQIQGTASIEGLRSPYEKVGGIVHFGRMLDKVRIHRAGRLPEAWVAAMGGDQNYDGICCRFLGISYEQITREVARQTNDEDLLEWTFVHGRRPSQEQILIWNAYMTKRNWRDKYSPRLRFRLEEAKMPINAALTMFDFIDLDEGRPLRDIALDG